MTSEEIKKLVDHLVETQSFFLVYNIQEGVDEIDADFLEDMLHDYFNVST